MFAWLAFLGFTLAALVHVASLMGVDVQAIVPSVWLLHLGAILLLFPVVLAMRDRPPKSGEAGFRELPIWAWGVSAALMFYTVVSFLAVISSRYEGDPRIEAGTYVLDYKGRTLREIGEAEFHARRSVQMRVASGMWLVFYFVPFAFFALRRFDDAQTPS